MRNGGLALIGNGFAIENLMKSLRNNQQFALLVGAGISTRSGIPDSRGVVQVLRTRYPEKFQEDREYGYAEAFNIVFPGREHAGERRRIIEELMAGKTLAKVHRLVAHLVENRIFSITLTTNFDHLTEIALLVYCTLQPRVYLYDEDIEPSQYSDRFPKLLKLHGDFLFDDLANLEEEMRNRLNENMRQKAISYLQGRGLVVVGYGGNDGTIMNLLEEAAKTREGLKNGLYWTIYKEEHRTNPRLVHLIRTVESCGKNAQIVGPVDATCFLKYICHDLGVGEPKPIPFGINPERRNPFTAYSGFFGSARQLPPIEIATTVDMDVQGSLDKLEKAVGDHGVSWLVDTQSWGKSQLIGRLFARLGSEKVFYFSPRFAESPAQFKLLQDLESYAGAIGIPTTRIPELHQLYSHLLKKGVTLVFDDLIGHDPYGRSYLQRGTKEIIEHLIAVQARVNRGNIVLISSSEPTEEVLMDIYHAKLEESFGKVTRSFVTFSGMIATFRPVRETPSSVSLNQAARIKSHISRNMCSSWPQNEKVGAGDVGIQYISIDQVTSQEPSSASLERSMLNLYENGTQDLKKTLKVMSLLRFAEFPEVIAKLAEVPGIRGILEKLFEGGFVERRGSKYILRENAQLVLEKVFPSTEEEHRKIAELYHEMCVEVPCFRVPHYALEAEYHYWASNNPGKAVGVMLDVAASFARSDPRFVYHTLVGDLFSLDVEGRRRLLAGLEPSAQIRLVIILYETWQGTLEPLADRAEFAYIFAQLLREIMPRLDIGHAMILQALLHRLEGDPELYVERLVSAEDFLEKGAPTELLGIVQLDLSGLEGQSPDISLRWARKAEKTFVRIGARKWLARARDNIAGALLDSGKFLECLQIEHEQMILQAEEPGFNLDKAIVYGNLSAACLLLGKIEEAEGYFFESCLNYASKGQWVGVLRHLRMLFGYALKTKNAPGVPSASSSYKVIMLVAESEIRGKDSSQVAVIVYDAIARWLKHGIREKYAQVALTSLRDFLRFAFVLPEEESTSECLFMAGLILHIFAGKVGTQEIIAIAEKEDPSHIALYTCYCEWLSGHEGDLDKLVESRGINQKWKEIMRKEHEKVHSALTTTDSGG